MLSDKWARRARPSQDRGSARHAGTTSRSRTCGPPWHFDSSRASLTAARAELGVELGFRGWRGFFLLLARGAPVFRRRHADLVQEETGEIALRGEAELGGHFGDLAAPGREPRDRGLDAEHVEVGARREAGAQLEEVVEARARKSDLARQLVHVQFFVRARAKQR